MRRALWMFLLAGCAERVDVEPVTDAEFRRGHTALLPEGVESWESIPWRLDLAAARQEAARRGRPLFLWTMNGHPMGCT